MRVLLAPNAFKGCCTARAAAAALARGARRASPAAELDLMPVSDGGDGLMEVLLERLGGRRVPCVVTGPLGERRRVAFARLSGGDEAVVEMAQASGLAGMPRLDPLGATSRGTGELIAEAAARSSVVIVGLGGSGTNDGGAGMAQALGARLLDARGRDLPPGAAALRRLARVDALAVRRRLSGLRVIAVSDVRNPLVGPLGSARVYGPQKGATPRVVRALEEALERYAEVLRRDLGVDVARLPGAGAAGGLGAGLAAFLGARLVPGAAWVLRRLGAAERVRAAGLVLTGEGRLDEQSFYGKAPVAVARLARRLGVPARLVCGQVDASARRGLARLGLSASALCAPGEDPRRCMDETGPRLAAAAARLVRDAVASGALACAAAVCAFASEPPSATAPAAAVAPARSTAAYANADALYFSRNIPGRLEACLALLESRIEEAEDAAALWRLGRAKVRLGERLEKRSERVGAYRAAERLLERAVLLDPKSPDAHYWLGVAYGRHGQAAGLMKSLFRVKPIRREMEAALALDRRYGPAHHVLGELLSQLPGFAGGSKKEALAHLERAVELSPRDGKAYVPLAEAYLEAGRAKEARETAERLLRLADPEDPAEYPDSQVDARRLLERLPRQE